MAESLLALEVTALTAFTFSRPVLDSFGRSPETFIARHATTADIVLFGLVVTFVPALVAVAAGAATRPFGPTVRERAHLGLVVVLGGLAAWRLGRDLTGWPNDATKLLLAGCLVGPLLGVLRWRFAATTTFLRYAGVASVVFLVQFLAMSPTTDVAFGSAAQVDDAVARQVAADLGDDPPPVVYVVLDAFPTTSLLDGSGRVDAELYPNIGSLAGDATWYRNHTSVAAFTGEAVPALLTGRYPAPDGPADDLETENLFTLLGGTYDLRVKEQVTRLCPGDLCARDPSDGLGTLVDDATTWWWGTSADEPRDEFDLPAVLEGRRYEAAEEWIDGLRVSAGGRPDLTFLHVVLPHAPWQFTDDGSLYEPRSELPVGVAGLGWSRAGYEVGRQRHILQAQAADRLVGQLLDRLRDAGVYDESLVVLTADHGESFLPTSPARAVDAENVPYIMWTPLFVKLPGQTEAAVDDGNVEAVDVVPTIADVLGVEIPWDVDGVPVGESGSKEHPHRKLFADYEGHRVHPEDGETYIVIDDRDHLEEVLAADPVAATGPDAVWRRTEHEELFGREVDDLTVGSPADVAFEVEDPGDLEGIDTAEPLPIEMIGWVDLPVGTPVAFALNGTVGAVTTVEDWNVDGLWLVHGLVPPDLFRDGDNELTAYLVEGPPGEEVLRPLDAGPR